MAARDHVPEYVVRRVKEMLNDNLEHEVCIELLSISSDFLKRGSQVCCRFVNIHRYGFVVSL